MSENGSIYNPQDRNRDGVDDDIDRRPGNSAHSESYSRIYDPRSEQEFTNLSEPNEQLQKNLSEQRRMERESSNTALLAAQQDVHFFPDVGKFIIPAENTWAAHAALVLNNDMRLHFNPDKYFFDKIIADKLNIPALVDRHHPDFDKYRGLRTNLEVLRNDIIGQYLDDGGFDKGDEVYIPPMRGIAETLASALANDVWWKRPFADYFSQDVANVEAVGAAEMYKFLLRQQQGKSGILQQFVSGIRNLLGLPDTHWGLLPLERTPFSPEALSAPPPDTSIMLRPVVDPARESAREKEVADQLAVQSLALVAIANRQTGSIDRLSANDKKISVEDGRTILRWLRNLQGQDLDVQDFLNAGSPQEQQAKVEALSTLVKLYAVQMHHSPHLQELPMVKAGNDAAGGITMMMAEYALSLHPEGAPAHALLVSAIDSMPETHFERSHQSVGRLLDHLERGLAELSGTALEKAAYERLLDVSARMNTQARSLRSVDTLEVPKREESVELGREILRKLRNMQFSDKPLSEQLDAGQPEDRAALAEKIEEMVEIYRNIVAEAVSINPGLADDVRVKEANDAVGGMTHGIILMASKDIPNSVAQAQQISADVTQDPKEWAHMCDRAVDRLLDTMEGGLEAAVDSMEQQEQDQQREEEMAQEIIEATLAQGNGQRSKRRRRKQQKSGLTGKKQLKIDLALKADDAAAGQGRFAQERQGQQQSAAFGLNANDMAAIRSLGTALKSAGDSAKTIPVAEVAMNSAVSPNDKTAAERAIESALQARRNQRRTT